MRLASTLAATISGLGAMVLPDPWMKLVCLTGAIIGLLFTFVSRDRS